MRPARLVTRSLAFHARSHAATLAGVLAACAVLTGALALGDSVRASLARAAHLRVGEVRLALGNGERFFGADLVGRLRERLPGLEAAAVIQLPAVAATSDGSRRASDVQLLGVDAAAFAFAPTPLDGAPGEGEAWVGSELARQLGCAPGDELVLRVPRPSEMTRELALSSVEEAIRPLRVRVTRLLEDEELGVFSLEVRAGPRANLFVQRAWLGARLEVDGRANRAFLRGAAEEEVEAVLADAWELADVGLAWNERGATRELVSDQVFLPPSVEAALRGADPGALALTTYFVNGIASGAGEAPYSMVTALGPLTPGRTDVPDEPAGWRDALGGLARDELVLNRWTADDLGVAVGDEVTLRYFVLGPGRTLAEQARTFRVQAVLPMQGLGADATLTPEYPGIGDAEDCRDWDPGIPVDLDRIRDVDEEYWDAHRGAPKAFVAPAAADEMWRNRFGGLTAVRVAQGDAAAVEAALRRLAPGDLGLPLVPVTTESAATSDFGGLFLGLSFFLILSALLLTGLFFGFSLERRASELGVLRVSGFQRGEVARLQLSEALLLCAVGAALGVGLGLVYTRALLAGLEGAWRGAVGRIELVFEATPATLVTSFALAVLLALGAVGLVLRRALRTRELALLWGELGGDAPTGGRPGLRRALLVLALLAAPACLVGAMRLPPQAAMGPAFGAGLALLVAGIAGVREVLARRSTPRSLLGLGFTGAARRPARGLTTVALVASSVFLLVVAGASRQGPTPADAGRSSGTGGFAFLGRTSLPVLQDLEAPEGRRFYGLGEDEMRDVDVVPLRVRSGDEASCLNLDAPRQPRLMGVDPARLAGRFTFARVLDEHADVADPWSLLARDLAPTVVPAVVDATSLQWTLKRALGDELELVDGGGRPFRARVVASVEDSILQGDVLISQAAFERLFPDEVGFRGLLVDAPPDRREELSARLTRVMADEGLVLTPAHERLDLLHGVQNTYLSIFQALGGLGLVLGSVGLLALVLRTAVERRGELALMTTLGFTHRELRLLFLGEQGGLVWSGLVIGALSGVLVVLPRLDAGSLDALRTLALLLPAVGLSGCLWVWLGASWALRGSLLESLNRE